MRMLPLTVVLLFALTGCGKPNPLAPPSGSSTEADDLKLIAGHWGIEKFEILGDEPPPPEFLNGIYFTVNADKNELILQGARTKTKTGSIKFDPTKNPKQVDITHSLFADRQDDKPETTTGIYKLEGEKLTVALAAPRQARPTDFKPVPIVDKGEDITGVIVVTFKKISNEDAAKRAAPKPKPTPMSRPSVPSAKKD